MDMETPQDILDNHMDMFQFASSGDAEFQQVAAAVKRVTFHRQQQNPLTVPCARLPHALDESECQSAGRLTWIRPD